MYTAQLSTLYIRRLDSLCVVLAVIIIIKIIKSLGNNYKFRKKKKKASMQNNYKFRKKKKKASMHASNKVLQQHETTTEPLR